VTMITARQELAVILVLSAGEALGRDEVRAGPAGEEGREFITALADIEVGVIEREWLALERWLAYMAGAKVEDEFERARLIEDFLTLGWHLRPPEGGP